MADKGLGALSLCKKAGALTVGFDAVKELAYKGDAWLVLFAEDASPATQKRLTKAIEDCAGPDGKPIPLTSLPYTQQQLMDITRKPAAVLAVTNQDLAVLCLGAFANSLEVPDEEERV